MRKKSRHQGISQKNCCQFASKPMPRPEDRGGGPHPPQGVIRLVKEGHPHLNSGIGKATFSVGRENVSPQWIQDIILSLLGQKCVQIDHLGVKGTPPGGRSCFLGGLTPPCDQGGGGIPRLAVNHDTLLALNPGGGSTHHRFSRVQGSH